MWNPFLKVEWLKEGRNIRLPMMLIFYNAILAFITILFMFFLMLNKFSFLFMSTSIASFIAPNLPQVLTVL